MSVQVGPARCERCEASGLTWASAPGGVRYLRDANSGEHWQTCAGVPFEERDETPAPTPARAPDDDDGEHVYAATLAALERDETPDDDLDALNAQLDDEERAREAYAFEDRRAGDRLVDWPVIRAAILSPRKVTRADGRTVTVTPGGIGPSPDHDASEWPGDLYRVHGAPPDIVAAETRITTSGGRGVIPWASAADDTGTPDDERMRAYLWRSWETWRAAQEARRPRPRRTAAAAPRPVREALAAPTPAPDMRAAVLSMARLVADVADLVAAGAAPALLARQVADAARTLAETGK